MTSPASCGRPAGKTRGSWHHPQGQLLLQAGTHQLSFCSNQHLDCMDARTEGIPKLRGGLFSYNEGLYFCFLRVPFSKVLNGKCVYTRRLRRGTVDGGDSSCYEGWHCVRNAESFSLLGQVVLHTSQCELHGCGWASQLTLRTSSTSLVKLDSSVPV